MTLFAGIVSRKPGVPVPAEICDALTRSISRDRQDGIKTASFNGAFFVKFDIGAFGEPAVVEADGALTMVAGEPLIDPDARGRLHDAEQIHHSVNEKGGRAVLRGSAGAYCAVHYDPAKGELTLIADKLGIRPLYYHAVDDHVIFAGALRILEGLEQVPKVMDVRAVTEIVGLGYALSDRTPYADVKMLGPAEVLRVSSGNILKEIYWKWDALDTTDASEAEHLSNLYRHFENAVQRRNRDDTATTAYLSGGLDSRLIVAALRDKEIRVQSYNFARPNTQDLVFGREFARVVGAMHSEIPKESGDMVPDFSALMAAAIKNSAAGDHPPDRPALVWSGEGGSVVLGHVHLNEQMAAMMRSGDIDRVISTYIERESAAVAPRLFTNLAAKALDGILEDGIRTELSKLHSRDAARKFYLFLLLNDQHRKVARHFENIDLHRLELQLPFFDSEFIAAILPVPLDLCLRHRLYVRWLSLFPSAVTAVPWQAYPGHEPCPVAVADDLAYQWSGDFQTAERSSQRRRESAAAACMLQAKDFPGDLLSSRNLRLAALVHKTGFRNYQYLFGPALTYHSYWQRCGGRYLMP